MLYKYIVAPGSKGEINILAKEADFLVSEKKCQNSTFQQKHVLEDIEEYIMSTKCRTVDLARSHVLYVQQQFMREL